VNSNKKFQIGKLLSFIANEFSGCLLVSRVEFFFTKIIEKSDSSNFK
jgi:hypothetical protein